jgi:LAO/AO transport system kinase
MEMLLKGLAESVGSMQGWRIPVVRTVATESEGIDDLVVAIESHREYLESSGQLEELQRHRMQRELIDSVIQLVGEYVREKVSQREIDDMVERIVARETDPATATEQLMREAGLSD